MEYKALCPECRKHPEVTAGYTVHDGYVEIVHNHGFVYDNKWAISQAESYHTRLRAQHTIDRLKPYLHAGSRVLDYGCGCGVLVDLLNKANYRADGIDKSHALVDYCKEHMTGSFYLNTESIAPHTYDAIVLEEVIEHFSNPQVLLDSVLPLLARDGVLYVETPCVEYGTRCIKSLDHKTCFTPSGLSRLLTDNGFKVLSISTKTFPFNLILQQAGGLPQSNLIKSRLVVRLYPLMRWVLNNPAYNLLYKLSCWQKDRKGKGYYLIAIVKGNLGGRHCD